MIQLIRKKKLTFITLVYWFFILYVVAELVWWFISLETQNQQMYIFRLEQLNKDDVRYTEKLAAIEEMRERKTFQYIGEGSIFFLFILVGAVFIYRAVRKQFYLSRQHQNFMMAVTHELKTPIAVTQLNLETLQKRKLEEAQQQKIISSTLKEANRLNELTNNILVASQLEAGAYYLNKQEVNLSEISEESFKEFEQRFPARELQKKIQPDLYVEGEQLLLQLLINNLLDNAIKYSSAEKTVLLILEEKNKEVKLSVTDEGIGISDAEKKRVFDKFYRIGSESTRTAKGTGLGLYLCKKIVHEFKGTITIENNKPQGSIFTVTLKQLPHE